MRILVEKRVKTGGRKLHRDNQLHVEGGCIV